ncbi:argininosuccinate lyase [Polycladomyces subterraneus]|uniref:Argininosuccinate lyase n=1 Tax=Polycladomyces subterraneus TaxID=1016997 RepID=A0ABT8IKL1_9BACL|nr:argininosuccinate lyase [Polycladomyces subterraneus]MDN4593299.1 argininosuccinate lyase [Polycladomyces subterraneus]
MSKREEWLKKDGATFPGKTYVECLLKPVFNYQRDYLFSAMFQVHRAHVLMLCDRGILSKEEAARILDAIERVAALDPAVLRYDPRYEDLFFMMEARLTEEVGPDLAGNMHIARSRNDMGVTMYRLVLREQLLELLDVVMDLRESLLEVIGEHLETVMPAYTHTQPAQPTTLGHYLLAIQDVLGRDTKRVWAAFHTVNQSPMGAAAITTSGFDICRDSVRKYLGFEGIVENSYDAIAGADYLLEVAAAMMVLMTNVGRWIQDLLLFCTREFDAVKVADPYVQISSIMPQKRNPVSVEHSRSIASSAIADAQAVFAMVHNTPFGDIVDTEDDLQPHLYRSIDKALRVLKLMNAVVSTLEVNRERLMRRAREDYITITELADAMVRKKRTSFRIAHRIAGLVVKKAYQRRLELDEVSPELIEEASREVMGNGVPFTEEELKKIWDPNYFIAVRKCLGGPSPGEAARMLRDRRKKLSADRTELQQYKNRIRSAQDRMKERIQQLTATLSS